MESARKPQTEPKQHQDWTNVWTTLSAGDEQSQQAPYLRMIGRAAVAADMAQQHHQSQQAPLFMMSSAGDAQDQQAPFFTINSAGDAQGQQAPLFMMSSGAAVGADMAQQHHHHWRNSTSSAGDAQDQQAPFFTINSAGDAQGRRAPLFMMSSGAAVGADMAQQHHHHWRNSGDHACFEAGFDTNYIPVQSG
jgi:hypothetical protein